MPPAGRRKAAADSAESTEPVGTEQVGAEQVSPEKVSPEPDSVEDKAPEEAAVEQTADADADADADETDEPAEPKPSRDRSRVSVPVVLAAIALLLAVASGVLRWLTVSQDESDTARAESVQAAKEITVEMLSYETETVDQQLTAARDRMTGEFLGTYTAMINEVIPAAHAQRIAAVADVLRIGTVTAKPDSVEVVLFVNQSVQVGDHMPEKTPSVARATMVKDGDSWLMSKYEPVPL
jgi:Mce-associated membrane protein